MPSHEQARRDELYLDPYPLYARARRAGGLTYVPECDAWLVARDRDVREVLLRPEDFSSANALTPDVVPAPAALAVLAKGFGPCPTVVTSDGAEHARHRAVLNRALSARRVAALVPYARQCARELADGIAADGAAELMGAYARRLPGLVIGRLIGLDPADVPAAVHGGYRAEELLFRPLPPQEQVAAASDVVALQHLLDRYVRDRRASPRDDLCSTMVAALAPGDCELTLAQRQELVASLQNLLIAGFLTTAALIGSTLLHLLRDDRAPWERLCADPALIPAAVEEAARYDTAVQAFRRITTRPLTLAARPCRPGPPSWSPSDRPTGTPTGTSTPTGSTSTARWTAATSPSARGRTAARARSWPGSNCGSHWTCSPTGCPTCASPRTTPPRPCAPP